MGEIHRQFGAAVKARREKLGWSTREFAERSGMARTYLVEVELGKRNPGLTNVERIAHALGVEPGDLFPQGRE